MASVAGVGKKLALNLYAKGKNLKPSKKTGPSRDELDIDLQSQNRKNSHDSLSANISVGTPLYKVSKSSSMGSVYSEGHDTPMDHEQIVLLTHYVRGLSESLAKLKAVFCQGGEVSEADAEELRVSAHEKLGDVLGILKEILQKYPYLHTTDVLTTAAMLITKIKSSRYEEVGSEAGNILYMIDQLSLAFSSSVSDYLMGDLDNFPTIGKTKSYDNLASGSNLDDQARSPEKGGQDLEEDIDAILQHLEGHAGVDRALNQAKLWAKYVKEVITYVEKKNALENEYSKNLSKLANSLKNSIMKETFLPMQAIFGTAFDQDMDYCAASQTTHAIVHTQKFVEPLSARRQEHEKYRKHLKDTWAKELKRMQEAVTNLHKAKSNYVARMQEHEKARESTQKTEVENQAQSSTTTQGVTKLEKKRKVEDDAQHKATEAKTIYQACVADANQRQKELEKVKCRVLGEVRDLIYHSDEVMKQVTVAYFQLLHTLTAPKPVQFQTLCEASQQYDPGTQYLEYVKRIHVPADMISTPEPFTFEPYAPEFKVHDIRKPSSHSSGSSGDTHNHPVTDESPLGKEGKHHGRLRVHGEEDTDSISDSSSRSQESSPTASPYQGHRHSPLAQSYSLNKLGDGDGKSDSKMGVVSEQIRMTFRGVALSAAAQTHLFKKLRTLSKCRECESYVYFQGAECERCGLSTHKRCLETLHWDCGHKAVGRRMTTFGVDFSEHVLETHTDIPRIIWKCIQEIDERGLDIKGIYRVSGVKSKVESLCQGFEMDESNVDLSEHHPNVIANVLKLYLRQLPEPLMSFKLYPDFVKLAKDEHQAGGGQGPAAPEVLKSLSGYVRKLSKPHFKTCGHLMHHLKRVTENQEVNQMNAYNLGVVFGPTLLRQSEDAVSLDSLLDTPGQTRVVELLIVNVDTIFGTVDQFLPIDDNAQAVPEPIKSSPSSATVEETKDKEHKTDATDSAKKALPCPGSPESKQVATPTTPTLLEIVSKTKPGSEPSSLGPTPPRSPSAQDFFLPEEDSLTAEADLSDSLLPDDSIESSQPASATIEYKTVSRPSGQIESLTRSAMSTSSLPTILTDTDESGQKRSRIRILPSQVMKSRDSSPTDLPLPQLTKPVLFTPPSHRRLCRTGTGGLFERPTTPDPLPEDREYEIKPESFKDRARRKYSLDSLTASKHEQLLIKSGLVTPKSPEADSELPTYTSLPEPGTVPSAIFYRDLPVSSNMTSLPWKVDSINNNNSNLGKPEGEETYPVFSPGAKSTFYTPSPRFDRKDILEAAASSDSSPNTSFVAYIPHPPLTSVQNDGKQTSPNTSRRSPSTSKRNLVPKDVKRQPKYV